jgi:hypothetical protein
LKLRGAFAGVSGVDFDKRALDRERGANRALGVVLLRVGIPRLEAILLRAAGEASRGDARALRLLLQLTERYGEIVQTGADREVTGAEDLAILRRYLPDFDDPSC